MKFFAEFPIHSDREGGRWLEPANIVEFARVAESSGADALVLTDHPAPSKKWLDRGGHETIDPFVGLGFFAAVTTRVRLMTYLTVVPYRNPILTAKSMTAVDVLSGGRTTFALGTGYLRSEFAALGAPFEERNELFDEAVEVMKGVWASDDFRFEGGHFNALGVVMRPGPVQQPHPPLWLGGNAKVVRDRVAKWGDGWAPLVGAIEGTNRTKLIAGNDELARMIREIGDGMEAHGRDRAVLDVASNGFDAPALDASVDEQLDNLASLRDMGITWTGFRLPRASSFEELLDGARRYGEEIVAKATDL